MPSTSLSDTARSTDLSLSLAVSVTVFARGTVLERYRLRTVDAAVTRDAPTTDDSLGVVEAKRRTVSSRKDIFAVDDVGGCRDFWCE